MLAGASRFLFQDLNSKANPYENKNRYYREFTSADTSLFFSMRKKNDQDDRMCQKIFRVFFQNRREFYEFYVFLRRARRVQNEIFASPLLVATRWTFSLFLNVWPWAFTRGNAVKISSMMGTMNIRNTRRVPTIRLNTRFDYLRLASYLQVRSAEKCRMVVLSSDMLTLVPCYRKLVEPSDFGVALTWAHRFSPLRTCR